MKLFADRVDAGHRLAQRLDFLRGQDVVVLGLPRGGVPVAFEVAEALRAPLDVLVVRKLGVPFEPELAFGAIGEGGVRVINDAVVRAAALSKDDMDAVEGEQRVELQHRVERFRRGGDPISLAGRVAVLVDDGIATGATAKAACQVARAQGASRVVLAVPIGPDDIVETFAGYADDVVCLQTPTFFSAVGQGYRVFTQTSDDEVVALLARARDGFRGIAASTSAADPPLRDEEVEVAAGPVVVTGHLTTSDGVVQELVLPPCATVAAGAACWSMGSASGPNLCQAGTQSFTVSNEPVGSDSAYYGANFTVSCQLITPPADAGTCPG